MLCIVMEFANEGDLQVSSLLFSIKSRKPSLSNKESLRKRSGKLPTMFSKDWENYMKPTLFTEISNLQTSSSIAKLPKLVI